MCSLRDRRPGLDSCRLSKWQSLTHAAVEAPAFLATHASALKVSAERFPSALFHAMRIIACPTRISCPSFMPSHNANPIGANTMMVEPC